MATNGTNDIKRKQGIVSSLCKHFSLDPKAFSSQVPGNDIKTIYINILKSSGKESPQNNDEVMKWIAFADSFPGDSKACHGRLNELNTDLAKKSVLLGNGFTPSEADVIVFSVIHSSVIALSTPEKEKLPHVMRWMDYIQNSEDLGALFEKILLEKPVFEPQIAKAAAKPEVTSSAKGTVQNTKIADKPDAEKNAKKCDSTDAKKKAKGDKEAVPEKKAPEKEASDKDKELSVSLLNIQVGLIRKAWKHPSADSLLVEEIDVGEAKVRQVVSGLAKYCSPEDLTVFLSKLAVMQFRSEAYILMFSMIFACAVAREESSCCADYKCKTWKATRCDVRGTGMLLVTEQFVNVLCASNEDHTKVEPLLPPEGAKPGERISFSGIDGKPEDVLNPKKKQLEKITPNLFTDEKGVATFKGIPFMTSAGPCTSSIPKASIK
ncbi:aminoacyl tRNA synthase complex-interacting multifunctional protein 1 isoform X1 [Gossypium australe]|uniref:Aminoacyl tRNA synthase complex-interacting multifunctional protein 1 isoform X1 n=1 Tax=Gossypium australe TaxID=47621 RepID=A0A5B6WHA5_9ROSI|nr:aminoacyl tRNA synthase complex-interacting multifunctional protein 1 isoform X1 [Gossypium australe]